VEGEADAFIFGATPSLVKMLWRIALTSAKDMAYCIKSFDLVNDDKIFRLCLETKTKFDINICSAQITLNEKYPNPFH